MQATADSLAFAPPPEPAAIRGFVLAVLAHLLLLAALTWGITWNRDTTPVTVEAELWSAIPKEAAPRPVEAPPPPPPVAKVEPPPPPAVNRDAEIAIEREKKREAEEKRQAEAKKRQQEAVERRERELEAKKQAEVDKARKERDAIKDREKLRDEQLRRMQALAGATGGPGATGTELRSRGPSASYAGKIAARIKPNIVFTDIVSGNPTAEVQIRVAPDGTIVGIRLTHSSGVRSWDDAVVRAVEKTGTLPRDTDGSVVPEFTIGFRPKD